jgi:hypothetical protein
MQTEGERMRVTITLDAYAGCVTSTDDYVFRAEVGVMPPYAGALPVDEAIGLSGSPCLRIERLGEIDSRLSFCGIHRAAGAGAICDQKLSSAAAKLNSLMDNNKPAGHDSRCLRSFDRSNIRRESA